MQTFMAAHSGVTAFSESHFFAHLFLSPKRARLGYVCGEGQKKARAAVAAMGLTTPTPTLPGWSPLLNHWTRAFTALLDKATLGQGNAVWSEKTPKHLHHITYIRGQVAKVRFIHMLRRGEDVVASLYAVSRKHPEHWNRRSLVTCVQRWVNDVEISRNYFQDPRHFLVKYEDLLADPGRVLKRICSFLEIPYAEEMSIRAAGAADQVIAPHESWKAEAAGPLAVATKRKFETALSEKERAFVRRSVLTVDYDAVESN